MRSTIIKSALKTALAVSLVLIFSIQMASATTSSSFYCSSNLVVSFDNGYSASCDGDFSFTDGLLQNDTSISLTAGGLLNINANASLNAPLISLTSDNILLNGILNAPNSSLFEKSGGKWVVTRTWSQTEGALIDAGRGSKTATSLSPQIIQTDFEGNITILTGGVASLTGGVASSSGIRLDSYDSEKGGEIRLLLNGGSNNVITT